MLKTIRTLLLALLAFQTCVIPTIAIEPPPPPSLPFPELRPVDGLPDDYAWTKEDGPDFIVYRAKSESGDSGAGMYIGMRPKNKEVNEWAPGKVAGHSVQWIRRRNESASDGIAEDALFKYQHDNESAEVSIHIWVYADDSAAAGRLKEALEDLSFEKEH